MLDLQRPFNDLQKELSDLKIETLPISFRDTEVYLTLPLHHRDPFDRIIIAQAIHHELPLISQDGVIDAYPVQKLWF
jgi:PIN domain nuclease of toxin-antitoxin system